MLGKVADALPLAEALAKDFRPATRRGAARLLARAIGGGLARDVAAGAAATGLPPELPQCCALLINLLSDKDWAVATGAATAAAATYKAGVARAAALSPQLAAGQRDRVSQ